MEEIDGRHEYSAPLPPHITFWSRQTIQLVPKGCLRRRNHIRPTLSIHRFRSFRAIPKSRLISHRTTHIYKSVGVHVLSFRIICSVVLDGYSIYMKYTSTVVPNIYLYINIGVHVGKVLNGPRTTQILVNIRRAGQAIHLNCSWHPEQQLRHSGCYRIDDLTFWESMLTGRRGAQSILAARSLFASRALLAPVVASDIPGQVAQENVVSGQVRGCGWGGLAYWL